MTVISRAKNSLVAFSLLSSPERQHLPSLGFNMTYDQLASIANRAAAAVILAVAVTTPTAVLAEGIDPIHVRVTWTSDPAHEATVSWSTAEPGQTHSIQVRLKGDDAAERTMLAESGRFTGGEPELYYHHAQLTDLAAASEYELTVTSDESTSRTYWFRTAPADSRPIAFLHGGDSRSDSEMRRQVNQLIERLVSDSLANEAVDDDIIAMAHGGDFILDGRNLGQWSQWLSDHELTTSEDGRLLPVVPTRGNHDRGVILNQVFGLPDDDLNYYAVDLNAEVRLVTLNSEISTAGDQAKWLDEELAASRPAYDWLLAQYHRPAFPAVKKPGTTLASWVPLFEKHNVDLVCESDGHAIKRTVPIRNGQRDETGVVYVGEGGMGVPQRTPKLDRWYLEEPGFADAGHHVFRIGISDDQLTCECVLLDGSIRDQFTRMRRPH